MCKDSQGKFKYPKIKNNQKLLKYCDLETHLIITHHNVLFHLPRQTFKHCLSGSLKVAPSITLFLAYTVTRTISHANKSTPIQRSFKDAISDSSLNYHVAF